MLEEILQNILLYSKNDIFNLFVSWLIADGYETYVRVDLIGYHVSICPCHWPIRNTQYSMEGMICKNSVYRLYSGLV